MNKLLLFSLSVVITLTAVIWNAYWVQDIWANHLVEMLGNAPTIPVLACAGLGFRAMFPNNNANVSVLSGFLLGPISWMFANFIMWVF